MQIPTENHQSHPQSEEFFHGVVVPNSLNESQKTEIKDEPSENELNNDSEEHLNGYIENVDEALENQENNVNSEDLRYVKFNYLILEAVPPNSRLRYTVHISCRN